MKRFIALLALLLPANAWGLITLSTFSAVGSGGTGSLTTPAVDTTGASLLVVNVNWLNSSSLTSVSDNKSNVFTSLTATAASGNQKSQIWYCANANVGSGHTFTANGASLFCSLSAIAVASGGSFDQQNAGETNAATTQQPGSVTPGADNEIVITGLGFNAAGLPVSINSGFTITTTIDWNANNFGSSMAYIIQTTAGAVNPTWTRTNSNDMSATIATFQVASGVAGPVSRWKFMGKTKFSSKVGLK